jgi:hypothetical protein
LLSWLDCLGEKNYYFLPWSVVGNEICLVNYEARCLYSEPSTYLFHIVLFVDNQLATKLMVVKSDYESYGPPMLSAFSSPYRYPAGSSARLIGVS